MLRKTILALTAGVALGVAALAPNAASAKPFGWGGGWHHGWHGVGIFAGPVVYGYDCMVQRWVRTPYGPRLRWVNICY